MSRLRKLRWQLMVSYLPLIIVPLFIVGLVTRKAAEQGISVLVTQGAHQVAQLLSPCFVGYYEAHSSWDGLSALLRPPTPALDYSDDTAPSDGPNPIVRTYGSSDLHGPIVDFNMICHMMPKTTSPASNPPFTFNPLMILTESQQHYLRAMRAIFKPGDIVVADPSGNVVASNDETMVGQSLSATALTQGQPISVHDQTVGILVIGTALTDDQRPQIQVLDTVNLALIVSGGISALLALGLAWGVSGQITTPMSQLMAGVKRLSNGEWSSPLKVHSTNEFGDLTGAFNGMAHEVTYQQELNRQMVADIAHDLRTPLSVMLLEVEAIEAGFQTPEDATMSLRKEITFLQRLVDDLRLLSLIDADQIHLLTDGTPLYPFLGSVFDIWQIMAEEQDRTLSLDAPEKLPDVPLDPARMRQVLGNLIDNAIQYTKPGGHITLGARSDGSAVTLWVSDDGEGIAPEDLPHIFDRFYRSDPSRARNSNGSGLGLSISRRLVEMHHATIDVRSKVGRGTTFTITIPLKLGDSKDSTKRNFNKPSLSEKPYRKAPILHNREGTRS